MNATAVINHNRIKKARYILWYTYFTTLKVYRELRYSQAGQCVEKNLEGSLEFLNQFRKHILTTGAVAQSSQSLSKYITSLASLEKKDSVVELGSGTGVFTKEILKKLPPTSNFFAIEINEDFVDKTKECCPQAKVYNEDAKNIQKILNENNLENCDCVISGLPWSCFGKEKQEKLVENIHSSLEDNGEFLTFAYIQSQFLPQGIKFKKLLEEKFQTVTQTETVWTNLPPAFVYHCIK